VVRREVEVIRRRAKNPETFAAGIAAFYDTHGEYVRTAVTPAVAALTGTMAATGLSDAGTPQVASCAWQRGT
jgi:predicted secreted Zn-dependent protease